jgi:hypothetical protein
MNTRNLLFITLLVLAAVCAVAADGDKKSMLDKMKDAVNQAKATVEEKIGMSKKSAPVVEEPVVAEEEPAAEEPAEEEEPETEAPEEL